MSFHNDFPVAAITFATSKKTTLVAEYKPDTNSILFSYSYA